MIFPVDTLILELGKIWNFKSGDLIYTGTPSGVGPVNAGDTVELVSVFIGSFLWRIVNQI